MNPKTLTNDPFLRAVYVDFFITSIAFSLFFLVIFIFIRHHLILPLQSFRRLILTKKREEIPFFISNFTRLYAALSASYTELEEKEKSLESAIYIKEYLYKILHTMDLINRLLMSDRSIEEIMTQSCELLAQHGHYHLAWMGNLVDDHIDIVAHSHDNTHYTDHLTLSLNPNDPTSKGPSAQSIIQNKTIITPSIHIEYYAPWKEQASASGHASSICLPLRASEKEMPFGTLAIYATKPFGFLEEEIIMLEDLAGDIGYAIASRLKKEELQKALTQDYLTGFANRSSLLEVLHTIEQPNLLLININRFRDINTVYGFDAGDFVLVSFAKLLKTLLSSIDGKFFRLHSDTYAILLGREYSISLAAAWIDVLSGYLNENPLFYHEVAIWLSITASYNDTVEQTIENGEIALKHAKDQKRLFLPFVPSMRLSKEHEENIVWYKIIKDALKEDRVVPYFQGIRHNATQKITKYEALIRIVMPDGKVISPFKFLDIAKKTGLYSQLTHVMVTKSIEQFRHHPAHVSINLSTQDIHNDDTMAFLRESLIDSKMGNKVVFEILESEGIDDYDRVSEFIKEFKTLGCQFSIDDFGAGFSNFEHLIRLQVDFLKIDSSLIKNLPHDKNAQIIVKNIQNFASEMGMATIAEFVSSQAIAELVSTMGITYSQGFYFSEPSPTPLEG